MLPFEVWLNIFGYVLNFDNKEFLKYKLISKYYQDLIEYVYETFTPKDVTFMIYKDNCKTWSQQIATTSFVESYDDFYSHLLKYDQTIVNLFKILNSFENLEINSSIKYSNKLKFNGRNTFIIPVTRFSNYEHLIVKNCNFMLNVHFDHCKKVVNKNCVFSNLIVECEEFEIINFRFDKSLTIYINKDYEIKEFCSKIVNCDLGLSSKNNWLGDNFVNNLFHQNNQNNILSCKEYYTEPILIFKDSHTPKKCAKNFYLLELLFLVKKTDEFTIEFKILNGI